MTIILDLPQELERELSDEAARQGVPLAEYALRILTTGRPAHQVPTTGAELVNYWQNEGLMNGCEDVANSQAHARHLREQAERRIRE